MALLDDDMMMFELIDIETAHPKQKRHAAAEGPPHRRERPHPRTHGGAHRGGVVIYGSTLGIIGQPEEVEVVRRAVEMILDGAPHGAVYSFLERKHNELTQGFNVRQNN